MTDGIYQQDTVNLMAGVTLQPVEGARPIITRTTGTPPAFTTEDNCTVKNIWLGGTKTAALRTVMTVGDNCTIDGNTFFNYYEGIAEGGHVDNLFQNNRFVNCGTGGYWHDIYISGDSRAMIYNNTHIGGQGYKIHLWHSEANIDVQGNFVAEGFYAFVMQHVTDQAIDNIFWNHTPPTQSWMTVNIGKGTFAHNLFGHRTFGTGKWDHQMNGGEDDQGLTVDSLGLVGDEYLDTTTWPGYSIWAGPYHEGATRPKAPGTNSTHYALEDLPALLGYSEAQIDAAVAALIASFSADLATIHDDATIEGNFAILRACVDAWKLV